MAQKCLSQIVNYKTQEIETHLYIIENSLFILWRHLDFYFLHCIPSDEEHSILHGGHVTGRMRKLHEWSTSVNVSAASSIHEQTTTISDGVTRDEIETLKQEASNCLTDLLLKKMVDLEQNHGKDRTRVGFIRVLVRRIKRLLTLHCSLVNEPLPGR
ncbi:nuclear pore complex protein Nup205-like [Actinia tenebrosa]|nr:nuclear pore complex protein Nup205-like [Actinia tenebrosa]